MHAARDGDFGHDTPLTDRLLADLTDRLIESTQLVIESTHG